jgi:hypothetical protein
MPNRKGTTKRKLPKQKKGKAAAKRATRKAGVKAKKVEEEVRLVDQETGSACDFLSRVEHELKNAVSLIEDAKSEIQEAELDDAGDSIQKAMDILANEDHHRRLDRAAEMVDNKKQEIEELQQELL